MFGSPRRLDLRVVCTETTPTRTSLDIWPPFPITVICPSLSTEDEQGVENIIAAVERSDRVLQLSINRIDGPAFEKLIAAMHGPFPALTDFCLEFEYHENSMPVLPETFLGGSAPLLRFFALNGIPFPSFHKFILSATHIVELELLDVPDSGYISPEIMVNSLATLATLQSLSLEYQYPDSRPLTTTLPPPTRVVLPALAYLHLFAVGQYSEDFVARIDTPLLNQLNVEFLLVPVSEIPQLYNFIGRAERLKPFNQAYMELSGGEVMVTLKSPTTFGLEIICETPDRDLSSMTQTFSRQLPLLSQVEQLEIRDDPEEPFEWKYDPDRDPSQWLGLFHLFIAVQSLYVSKRLVPPISVALQEPTGESTMEVLPSLCNLYVEGFWPPGPANTNIRSFAAVRQRSGHPVTIHKWDR